jgi:endonuclease/exonuclease/phosphatase (EEP) superfamily protein YafD
VERHFDLRANTALRTAESEATRRWISRSPRPVLVAGDFNLPVDSVVYRRSWSWLTNAFSQAGTGFGSTKFTRWHGVRIDHVLGGPGWHCRRCWVGPDVGSDHRPVIADMVWGRDA